MYELSLVDMPFAEMEEGEDYKKLKDGRYELYGWEKTALDGDDMADALNSGAYDLDDVHIVFDDASGLYFIKEEMDNEDVLEDEELKAVPAEKWLEDYEPTEDMKEPVDTPPSSEGEGRFRGGAAQTYDGPVYRNMDGTMTDDQGNSVYLSSDRNYYYGDSSNTSSSVPAYKPAPTYDPTTYDTPQQQYTPQRTGPGYTEPVYDSAGNIVHTLYDQYENAKKVYDVATGMYELAEGSASGLASQAAGEALGPVYNVATGLYELAEAGSVAEFGTAALSLAGEVLPYLLIGLGNKGKKKTRKGGAKGEFGQGQTFEEFMGQDLVDFDRNMADAKRLNDQAGAQIRAEQAKWDNIKHNNPEQAQQITEERQQGLYDDGQEGPVYDSNGNIIKTLWDAATATYKVFSIARNVYTLAMATTPIGAAVAVFSIASSVLPGLLGWTEANPLLGFGEETPKKGGKKIPEAFAKGVAFAHAYAKKAK